MTGVVAYTVMVVAIAALLCGHHGEDFPPVLRTLRRYTPGPSWARSRLAARRIARATRDCEEAA
ncbi:hypothetical protein OG331_25085 [Streptomyces sp. NBC_01017]|uniref:hypothetical protein n=1 Tax=Streptomyces sp. NBC_01017 TaxID=2903721 RepID=UPI0038693C39|nr:hypothetical protein OG331_25085 [Streptomyces sp. NBC_01017]